MTLRLVADGSGAAAGQKRQVIRRPEKEPCLSARICLCVHRTDPTLY